MKEREKEAMSEDLDGAMEDEPEEYEIPDDADDDADDGDGDGEDNEEGGGKKRLRRKLSPEEKAAALQGEMIASALAKKLDPIIRAAGKIQYTAGLVVKRVKLAGTAGDKAAAYSYRIVAAHHYIPPEKDELTHEEVADLIHKKYIGVEILL